MKLLRGSWVVLVGLALVTTGVARAQTGEFRTYRGNELRTGYAYDPANPTGAGLITNQMPAVKIPYKDSHGTSGFLPSPDLTWIYPLDREGASLSDPGNQYPLGYTLGQMHSSPTVAGVTLQDTTSVLAVMFGSTTTVNRAVRNDLPAPRVGDYADSNQVYSPDLDPYNYLDGQKTGCVYSIEGFAGTTEIADLGSFSRSYKPLWWYGVRNLPFYLIPEDEDITPGVGDSRTYNGAPGLGQNRFFINASDSAMRAFDYSPQEVRSSTSPFGTEDPSTQDNSQKVRREAVASQWLAPKVANVTDPKATGPGIDSGAGVVGPNRADIPERLTDRLYNLTLDTTAFPAKRLGLVANAGSTNGSLADGPPDNRFRQQNGMGPINSSGAFVTLPAAITYTSAYYPYDSNIDNVRTLRRDPAQMVRDTGLTTSQLYIVGSDDGWVYAFDADPGNARRVPASGGTGLTSTFMGRIVWAFHAAARAPVYSTVSSGKRTQLSVIVNPPAEYAGALTGVVVNPTDPASALSAPAASVISGPIVSSPVTAQVKLAGTSFYFAGQTRTVVFVGSGMGRMFALDAATGLELWEFKTTPIGQGILREGTSPNFTYVTFDSVAGYAINTSPTLGYLPTATSQLRTTGPGRLAVFFGCDDGKVYALDAGDGSPIRESDVASGWDVPASTVGGTAATTAADGTHVSGTRFKVDHFGFVTYPFERGTTPLPDSQIPAASGLYGRVAPTQSKAVLASVVGRPVAGGADPLNPTIPQVDALFISSPTNQADASVGSEAAFSGGTVFCISPYNGSVKWTFDSWNDVTRDKNTDFDKDPTKDYTVRPSAFNVTPAYATGQQIWSETAEAAKAGDGEQKPLTGQNILFAIDSSGHLYPLRAGVADDSVNSLARLYWRLPYPLPNGGVVGSGNVYSSPVVSSPNNPQDSTYSLAFDSNGVPLLMIGRSYVFIGTNGSIAAIDTTATRQQPVTDVHNKLMTPPATGGEMSWAWEISKDVATTDTSVTPAQTILQAVDEPVVCTPVVFDSYVFVGGDNGLMYAFSDQTGKFIYGGGGTTGRGGYRGARPRPPLPPGNRPPGGFQTTADKEYYVEIFQAGFDNGFTTPKALGAISPTGAPPGATGNQGATSPIPIGVSNSDFQSASGGVLEWGDGIGVVAWGPLLDDAVTQPKASWGSLTFQFAGPGTSGSLRGNLESGSAHGYSRQIFYLNPLTASTPVTLLYPNAPASEYGNPLHGQMLAPGWRGQAFTVTAYYQPPDLYVPDPRNPGKELRTKQGQQHVKIGPLTKFHVANPINMTGYITGPISDLLASMKAVAKPTTGQEKEADRNGNERVPIQGAVVGDHGTNTVPQNAVQVIDRSHLPLLKALANVGATGLIKPGDSIRLSVKIQPARLRWVGGPTAAFKPLIWNKKTDGTTLPNGMPLPNALPPEPLYAPDWGPQIGNMLQLTGSGLYIGAETPPFPMGEDNKSPDYPDIDAANTSWIEAPKSSTDVETDATHQDAPVAPYANFLMRVAVPKYQPANFSPSNVDPGSGNVYGVGPGYYTINPLNSTASGAAALAWNPGKSSSASPYLATTDPAYNNILKYMGPLQTPIPATASYVAQEPRYLTKVYVDVNQNSSADTDAGEPYRMFVSGLEVRPAEAMRVVTNTIDVPRSPETAIPAGYVPFQFYYDGQTTKAAPAGAEDPYLFGERAYYSPFAVYNTGNVNLWDLRMDKYDPFAGHLEAAEMDPNPYFGAADNSNWPGSGKLKRFNLASTLDALPTSGAGGPQDPSLWTPARKPTPGSMGDEGQGRIIQVKDVFSAASPQPAGTPAGTVPPPNPWDSGYGLRPRNGNGLNSAAGLPYLTVAVPPGTPPGRYATPTGRFVIFEDAHYPYNSASGDPPGGDGVLEAGESGVAADAVVMVNVAEARLTDKTTRLRPFLPNADTGVAMSASFTKPSTPNDLAAVWQTLAQDTTPAAYRDPATGDLVSFWSSNRVGEVGSNGFQQISPFTAKPEANDKYHIFATAMTWKDPAVSASQDVASFLSDVVAANPWGWRYQGGSLGNNFFFPNFDSARWFGQPSADPWIPDDNTVGIALGVPSGQIKGSDLSYTTPAVITDFHGVNFPRVLFFTGTTGIGPDQRSAIFFAPVAVDRQNGTVGLASGSIQAVGVVNGQRTLDPFSPKYAPRPFLITAGGDLTATGANVGEGYIKGEHVVGLGVMWFGGAPGAWKLYVSTIKTDDTGAIAKADTWQTTQLTLPSGVVNALHPSVYYHQMPKVFAGGGGSGSYRQGLIEVAFTGYNRSARNPDIYVVRYIAMKSDADGANPTIGDWSSMGFARRGGDPGLLMADKPLEPLLRVAGEPRPIFRSRWANWLGRRQLGTVIYWFQKPVSVPGQPVADDNYQLYATFTVRNPANNQNQIVEATGQLAKGGRLPAVTVFVDSGAGTVRFTTSAPDTNPAPVIYPHKNADGVVVQDFIYVAMNPYTLRVTADDDISDTMPQIWVDETHDVITDPGETNAPVTTQQPLVMRRDRMWVLWRRSAAPEGATRQSSLFYQTYRLTIDTGYAGIPLDANGKPQIEIWDRTNNNQVDLYVTVDRKNGRIFFTGANDGDQYHVHVAGADTGLFTVAWQPEGIPAPVRYGTGYGPGGAVYRLPSEQWTEPRAVPTQAQGNDSYPWMFKDPFSDAPPGDPLYYLRGNNSMWLFWASTRPSHSAGNTTSSPQVLGSFGSGIDPYYFNPNLPYGGGLMYAGSASDVYYTTLSPDFRNK